MITVEYPPEFLYGTNGSIPIKYVKHGAYATLNCNSRENEEGKIKWFYMEDRKAKKKELDIRTKVFQLNDMRQNLAGLYECIVENSVGFSTKTFQVLHRPKSKK